MEKSTRTVIRDNFKTVGKVITIGEMRSYDEKDSNRTKVLNFVIESNDIEDIGGIKIPITKENRITAFHSLALKAAKDLEIGSYVLLTECTEQISDYTNKDGQTRKMKDIVVNQINKISEEIYDKVKDIIAVDNEKVNNAPDFT